MKTKIFAWVIVLAMLGLVACGGTVTVTPQGGLLTPPATIPPNIAADVNAIMAYQTAQAEYAKSQEFQRKATDAAIDAQRTLIASNVRVTEAAAQAKLIAGQVTANANATREAIAGTVTRQAMNEQATRYASSIEQTKTRTAQEASGTATAQSVIAQQTQVSASATATAIESNAQQARIAAAATATMVHANLIVEEEKATWNQRMESLRAIASFVGVLALLIGVCVVVGFGAIRFIDAGVLRARIVRDKTGTVFVIGEKDKDGRQMVLVPGRSPGAAISIAPPGIQRALAEPQAIDEETTKRDQSISLMIAATGGKGDGDEVMAQLTDGDAVRFVEDPPAQLVGDDTKLLIDGDWTKE